MPHDSRVARFFAQTQETMKLSFRGWENDIPHPGEKGGIRERRVKDFLSSILPKKYGIGTGHIIDYHQAISAQTDIVIYDALNGIAIPVDNYYSLFPCECVYAALEVKSTFTASDGERPLGTIFDCVENTTKLRALDRASHSLPPIFSVVFAYSSQWNEAVADHVKSWFEFFGKKYSKRIPDLLFVLEPSFILRGVSLPDGLNEKGEFTHLYLKSTLLLLVSALMDHMSRISIEVPNLWNEYNNWQPGEAITHIYRKNKDSASDS